MYWSSWDNKKETVSPGLLTASLPLSLWGIFKGTSVSSASDVVDDPQFSA